MKRYGYLLGFTIPALLVIGGAAGGALTWLVPVLAFGLIPVLDAVFGEDTGSPGPEAVTVLQREAWYRWVTWLYVPVQYGVLAWLLWRVGAGGYGAVELLGLVLSAGVMTSAIGITIAHELGHRRGLWERGLARALLVSVCYAHFTIEHNLGHHRYVATPRDPATARRGESLYRFLPRAVLGGLRGAWRIEARRLRRRGRAGAGWGNRVWWCAGLSALLAGAVGMAFGAAALAFFLAQSAVAVALLEAVNYIEHYGLQRRELAPGRYEPVSAAHAWNSSHRVTNFFLFELQRHTAHHLDPGLRYQCLGHVSDSPQLPTGYAGMIVLALAPRWWRRVMDARLARVDAGRSAAA